MKLKKQQQKWILIAAVIILLLWLSNKDSGRTTVFGDTSFDYKVYNERGEDYDDTIITPELKIGDDIIIQGFKPEYTCSLHEDEAIPSAANKDCWNGNLVFRDEEGEHVAGAFDNLTLKYGEEIQVGKYFYITWYPSGAYRAEYDCPTESNPNKKCTGFKPYQWMSTYKIRLAGDFLKAYFNDEERIVALTSNKSAKIKILNDLSNNLDGGVYIKSKQTLYYKEGTEFIGLTLKRGENEYDLNLDTSILGYDVLTILPYLKFAVPRSGIVTIYDNTLSETTYNIVPNIDITVDTSVDCTTKACLTGFYCEHMSSSGKLYNICMRGKPPQKEIVGPVVDMPSGVVIEDEYESDGFEEKSSYLYTGMFIGVILILIYAIWEKGPNRGFIKK